jgi:hypothetical protein
MSSIDQIRELCAQAVAAKGDDEALSRIIPRLREAIHELMAVTKYPFHKDVGRRLTG